jgi:hypothetical protein
MRRWCVRRQADGHARELLRQANRRFDPAVDVPLNLGSLDAIAIAVLVDAEADAVRLIFESKGDSPPPRDGLCSRKGHSRSEISGGTPAA